MIRSIHTFAFVLSLILFFCVLQVHAQYSTQKEYNPEKLLEESKLLEEKSKNALAHATIYHEEGSRFLDSARYYNNILRSGSSPLNTQQCINSLETHYMLAYRYIAMSDSMTILAEDFREMSINLTREAFAQMGKDVEVSYTPVEPGHTIAKKAETPIKTETSTNVKATTAKRPDVVPVSPPESTTDKAVTTSPAASKPTATASAEAHKTTTYNQSILYKIQLGAGEMNLAFFSKVPEIQVVECKDGVKRFVLPDAYTKLDAFRKKEELSALGYDEIFIRTKESLDKIAK